MASVIGIGFDVSNGKSNGVGWGVGGTSNGNGKALGVQKQIEAAQEDEFDFVAVDGGEEAALDPTLNVVVDIPFFVANPEMPESEPEEPATADPAMPEEPSDPYQPPADDGPRDFMMD